MNQVGDIFAEALSIVVVLSAFLMTVLEVVVSLCLSRVKELKAVDKVVLGEDRA